MARSIHLSDQVLFRELEGEAVLLDLASQRYFGLEAVGTRIWQLVAEHGDRERILAELETEFAADPATLASDLDEFLEHLERAGLLRVTEPSNES
ncbi:MAG: PqqD family protein [Acidobacteria bacterium]|nr:PqqD family protein [Acidobacteriota bacterium]